MDFVEGFLVYPNDVFKILIGSIWVRNFSLIKSNDLLNGSKKGKKGTVIASM